MQKNQATDTTYGSQDVKLQLIVGLGNPGTKYQETRHNAGAWFVENIASEHNITLRRETKFHGLYANVQLNDQPLHLLIPTTYMNHSGKAIAAICRFYKIPTTSILIAHDDLDHIPGVLRIKYAGGHGGHNGLRDIINSINSKEFVRLRIGIGHPGHRDQVLEYVLNKPSKIEQQQIQTAIAQASINLNDLVNGNLQKVMKQLHTKDGA